MAMVKHSPVSQNASRPSWTVAPTSSTPPEADEPVSHTVTGSLHGAIGEHRRSSRSSSVSSGGSSTNSAEGNDAVRQHTQNRLNGITSAQLHNQDLAVESLGSGSMPTLDKKDQADILSGKDAKLLLQSQSLPDLEPKGTRTASEVAEQFSAKLGNSDLSPFAYFMGSQTSLDTPKLGRPITGQNSVSNSFSPSGLTQQAPEVDLRRLLSEPMFSPGPFVANVNQDMQHINIPNYFDFPNNSQNMPPPSDTDLGLFVPNYQPSRSNTNFGRNSFSGSSQAGFVNPNSNQFSSNYFSGSQGVSNRNSRSGFYSPPGVPAVSGFSNATGYYSPSRQSTEYFTTSSGSFQAFSSQDFSLPPPAQPWRGSGSSYMMESVHKRITCESCSKHYKWPHVLECLHVYCFPCMTSKYDPVDKSIVCPECSHKTPLKDGPCSLKLDYQGSKFMREVNAFPFNCTACTRDMEAVICCTTCMAYLCSECRDGHRNMNQFQNHTLLPITKIGRTDDGEYTAFCEKHPVEPLSKYCCVCECMICSVCISEHKHPDYPNNISGSHSLEEIYPIVVERLNNWNEDAHIKAKDVADMAKQAPLNMQHIESKRRSCRKQIDEYADYCKTVVEQNRQAAYELLDKTIAQMESDSLAWTTTASKITKELEAVTAFNTRTVQYGSLSDTLGLLELMESAYKRCVEHYSSIIKNNESIKIDLKFDPNYKESHAVLNQNFLSISYSVNGVEHKVLPTAGNSRSELTRGRSFSDYTVSGSENSDCNYQRWSAAPDSMSISTWNNVNDRDRKSGTFIPHLNRCRTKTSYIHMFGEYGRGEYAFTEPSGQAYLKDGSYVICDTNNHRIVYYNAKHEYVRTIGQPPNLPPVAEEQEQRSNGPRGKGFARQDGFLYFPNRVAICPITQNIVATERPPSHDVQIFTVTGEFVRCFGGNILQHPRGVTVDEDGIIIVVECKVMKLVMFNQDGSFIVSHSLTKDLEFPNDVAAKDSKIFISDNRGHCVQVFNYNAEFLYKIGNESITYFPIGVSINHLSQVVVTDNHNTFNITVFDMNGTVLHIFESVSKLAQCHNVAVHPSNLELMLTTKDCSVYFFNYDPNIAHPLTPPASRGSGHLGTGSAIARRPRGSGNGSSTSSSFY
ncbi:hypothetical protein BsWGS_17680 [Bradybaena similaris]